MKKKFIFLTMLLLTLLGGAKFNVLNAQETIVEIGEGSTTYDSRTPISFYYASYAYSSSQQIYYKDELDGISGSITHISFRKQRGNNNVRNLVVYIENTTKESFETKTDWVKITSEPVFNGSVNFGAGDDAWITIELDEHFVYDGNSNILLSVHDITGEKPNSSNWDKFYIYSTGTNRTLYCNHSSRQLNPQTGTEINGEDIATYSYLYTNNNQIRFTFVAGGDVTPVTPSTPTNLTATAIDYCSIALTWEAAENAKKYNVYNGENIVKTVSETSCTIDGLDSEKTYTFTVTAVNGSEESEHSNEASATTLAMPKLCNIVFTLKDTWGDGWNGNKLIVKYGSTTEELTLSEGKEGTYTLGIPEGSVVNMEYKSISYPAENSFEVKYESSGELIWSKTANYGDPLHNGGTHTFTIPVFKPIIEASVLEIALGNVRMGNYWTEKPVASANVEIKATATTITNISCDNNFFTLNYDLNQNPVALNVSYNKEANVSGAQSGNITITSADCEPVVIPVTATAYTPANGDIVEKAIEVTFTDNAFSHSATGMYDDYILPGEAEYGNLNDAVYKFTLANDGVVTANVNGANAIAAIYKAEDLQGNGPSSNNNYTGVQSGPVAETTFYYNFNEGSLDDFTVIDKDGNGDCWVLYDYQSSYSDDNKWIKSTTIAGQNNYIVTNDKYSITENSTFIYKIWAYNPAETVGVAVSEDKVNFETVQEGNYSYNYNLTLECSLANYAGKELYIALYHKNSQDGSYYLLVDNIQLTDGSAKSRAGEAQIDGVQYPAGTYYLVAAAEGDFTLNLSTASLPAPAEFAYTAPENNTIVEETNPELTWESAEYASSYDVYLGTTADALSKVAEDITATSFQTTGLSNNTKYYWQVVAKNSIGDTNGETWSFVTPLDVPQNVEASSNKIYPDDNNVTITWDAITGAKGYNVYVKVNGEGNAIKHNGNELVTTAEPTASYELSNMDYSLNGHVVYVTAVYEIEGGTYESNSSATQTIKVTDYTTLSVTVKDANEKPIEGATIVLQGKDEFGIDRNYNNLENGTYTLEVLLGTYTATITKLDYNDVVVEEVTLSYAQQSYTLDVVMQSKPSAPFTVYAEEGSASWDAEYASYNVYRRDSEGNVTSLATGVTKKQYQDADWGTLADGEYEYGVSAMVVETSYVTETFSTTSIPEGWTQNGAYTWNFNGTYAYLYQGFTDASPNNLITPLIDLSNESAPTISFKYSIGGTWTSSGYYNTLKVEVSESLNGPWTNIFTSSSYTSGFVNVEKSLSAFAGKKVYVKFVTDTDYSTTYIDDVVLPNSTTSESRINWSAPVEKGGITFTGDGYWNIAANWNINKVPEPTDKVTIKANATITENVTVGSIRIASGATLTVKEDVVLNVTNGISNTNAAALVMEDGAQIIQTNSNVAATFNMNIVNPTQGWGKNKDGWQFIASPLLNAKTSAFETSGENNDFDLYKYDGTQVGEEWVNYKDHQLEGDNFFYDFSDGMQGWTTINANNDSYTWGHTEDGTGKNFTYGAPNGYNGEKGCLFSDAVWYNSSWQVQYINPNDYVVSPERVMIVKDSKLSFYIQSASYNYSSGEITVLVSESENASAGSFVQIHSVNYSDKEWLPVTISLAEYAGKEVWIAIRHKINSAYNSYILIDNLELTDGKTRSGNEDLFETEFVNGRAYLASYQAETTATFTGILNNASSFTFENISFDSEGSWANFHLLGNPFSFDMDWSNITVKNVYPAFATVNPATGGYVNSIESGVTTIPVGDGFFVEATGKDPSISYNARSKSRGEKVEYINVVASGKQGSNNVIIKLSGKEERGFSKLENLNQSIADIYVKNNGRQYSVLGYDKDVKEVELFFDAKEMGNYTIGIEPNGKFQSVTLVDRMTGAETNMLLDSYTFTATANDNPNRFLIRLDNSQEPTANSNFVYQSGEELIVNAEGTIQIIDVMGRMVYSNDVESSNNRINVSNLKGATYIVRNISNNTVRTQKIVIL